MLNGIHHIGIAVKNLDEAIRSYENALNAKVGDILNVPERGMRVALLSVANCQLELIEPTNAEGSSAKFIESHGEGITHICFEVDDINKELESLSAKGIPLRDKAPRQGITGNVAFLQETIHGVRIELVEKRKPKEDK